MKLTNLLNLPQPIFDAVKNDGYTRGGADYSVTQLMSPARKVELERLHADEIVEDASDRIFSLMGQCIHTLLERANTSGLSERRLTINIDGATVSGGMDAYYPEKGLLQDYKQTTLWKFKDSKVPLEYEQQLNAYSEMLRQNGDKIERLEVVGILRDWSKAKVRHDPSYPKHQVVVLPIPLWPRELAVDYLRSRVAAHRGAREALPECTPEERWEEPTKYAVMKKGAKRAVRLYPNSAAAAEHAATDEKLYVEERPGEPKRCLNYCSAAPWCSQFKALKPVEATSDETW